MLTGDDGNGNSTLTTTLNNQVMRNEFIDNGDGLELTRGAAFQSGGEQPVPLDRPPTRSRRRASKSCKSRQRHGEQPLRRYSDGIQVNSGNRNYIGFNTFTTTPSR